MRKLMLTTVLALTVLASQSFAKGDEIFIHVNKEAKTFSVHQNTPGIVRLKIKNNVGNVLFTVSANKKKAFVKSFNLKDIPTGNYTLVVEDDSKFSTYRIDLYKDSLFLDKENTGVIFKPSVILEERLLDISMLTLNQGETAISIFNDQDEMVHTNLSEEDQINKRFDLSQLQSGQYTVSFNVGDEIFNRSIVLK